MCDHQSIRWCVLFFDLNIVLFSIFINPDDAECELNCKPIGMEYFATLDDRVVDGTTCSQPVADVLSKRQRRRHGRAPDDNLATTSASPSAARRAICVDGVCKVSGKVLDFRSDHIMRLWDVLELLTAVWLSWWIVAAWNHFLLNSVTEWIVGICQKYLTSHRFVCAHRRTIYFVLKDILEFSYEAN